LPFQLQPSPLPQYLHSRSHPFRERTPTVTKSAEKHANFAVFRPNMPSICPF
jgi:hypothetical protein